MSTQFRLIPRGDAFQRLLQGRAVGIMAKTNEAEPELRKWTPPTKEGKYLSGLNIRNSLAADAKVEFVPEVGSTTSLLHTINRRKGGA